jgi:hypothetical protein
MKTPAPELSELEKSSSVKHNLTNLIRSTAPLVVVLALAPAAWCETTILDVDFTKGPPDDDRIHIEGGEWDGGWRVHGELDRVFIDLGRDVRNGYVAVIATRKGALNFSERKRNWLGLSAAECMHQAAGGYARTGDPMYDFSKAEIFSSTQSNTICEKKFGKASDWVLDDQHRHVVRAEIRHNVMTWTNNRGGKTSGGSNDQPVGYFRFVAVGGLLDHKTGWHHGSLVGLRVLRVTVVEYRE